jgi:hypothetical protein
VSTERESLLERLEELLSRGDWAGSVAGRLLIDLREYLTEEEGL